MAGSPWCNQCFAALGVAQPEPPPAAVEVSPPPAPDVTATAAGPGSVTIDQAPEHHADTDDQPTWQCQICQESNPLTSDACSVCKTPIFVSFGGGRESEPTLSPSEALSQAIIPGLAHMRLGHGLIGFTIALLVWVLIGFALIIAFAGGAAISALIVFVVAIGIVLVSVHDAQRLAQRQADAVILKPRILTFVALGAIAMVVAIIWIQGISGASANT